MKAIRVDIGELYALKQDMGPTIAGLVADAKAIGADTIIANAINPVYGTYYNTTFRNMIVENGYGAADFMPALIAAAGGLNVIATIPATSFKYLASQNDWRAMTTDGGGNLTPYNPLGTLWQMSCSSTGPGSYTEWLTELVGELFTKCDGLTGVEINEPSVAPDWSGVPDLNAAAVAAFQAQNPGQPTNGPAWLQFRANALTSLIGAVGSAVKGAGKTFGVVQDLASAGCDLGSFADFSNDIGLDFDGIMNLPAGQRPDYVAAELIWQQAVAERGCAGGSAAWTGTAGADFVSRVAGRTHACIHVEMTGFPLGSPTIAPADLTAAIKAALAVCPDITVFEYTMIKQAGALNAVATGFSGN